MYKGQLKITPECTRGKQTFATATKSGDFGIAARSIVQCTDEPLPFIAVPDVQIERRMSPLKPADALSSIKQSQAASGTHRLLHTVQGTLQILLHIMTCSSH